MNSEEGKEGGKLFIDQNCIEKERELSLILLHYLHEKKIYFLKNWTWQWKSFWTGEWNNVALYFYYHLSCMKICITKSIIIKLNINSFLQLHLFILMIFIWRERNNLFHSIIISSFLTDLNHTKLIFTYLVG